MTYPLPQYRALLAALKRLSGDVTVQELTAAYRQTLSELQGLAVNDVEQRFVDNCRDARNMAA